MTLHPNNTLRKDILIRRDAIPDEVRRRNSIAITERLWKNNAFNQAQIIFFYANYKSEVLTLPFIKQCIEKGKSICVPLSIPENFQLVPYKITNPDKDLKPGYCNIPEPDPRMLKKIKPERIDLVILPGSVFDQNGGRLGYGGGYYDRFLAKETPNAKKIGIAFEMQVVRKLSLMPHDQLMDSLVTEHKTRHFNSLCQ